MGTFLRNVTLLAAVTAAGGFAIMKAAVPPASPPLSLPALVVAHEPPPSRIHSPISFRALIAGEEMHVRYASRGYFHAFEHNLVFSSAPGGGAALKLATSRVNLRPGYRFVTPSRLSRAELRQLDALLRYYRALRDDGTCTTRDVVSVALYRDGTLIAAEHFSDGTCGFRPDDNALTLAAWFTLLR